MKLDVLQIRTCHAATAWVAAALVVVFHTTAAAQNQPATPLTVNDAIGRAYATSQRLAESVARAEGAEAAIHTRESAAQPSVNVAGGYMRTNHIPEFGIPQAGGGFRVIAPDIPNIYYSRAEFEWPIYTAGRVDAQVRPAEAEARAATADVEAARADLRLEVVRTYWALVTAIETTRVVEEAVSRAETHLRDVRSQFDSGLIPPNDVTAAEAQRSHEQLQLIEARTLQSHTLEELSRLTGITGEIVPTELLATNAPPPPASTTERAEQRALAERITASEERVVAIERQRWPTIAVNVAGDYAKPNPKIFPLTNTWRHSWQAGVVVNWSAWDGGRAAAESAEAAAATRALRARSADLDLSIASEIRQRQLDVDSARAALATADDALRSATETRRVVAERFAAGVATSTDVLDAQFVLLQAELDRTRTLANIRLAEARLERARGVQ